MNLQVNLSPDTTAFDSEAELICQLYSSLTDKDGFHRFLQLLGEAIDAPACALSCVQRKPVAFRHLWHAGLPDGFLEQFIEQGMLERDTVINAAIRKSLRDFSSAEDALYELEAEGNADYWRESFDMSIQMGLSDAAWMVVHADDDSVILLSLMREHNARKYSRVEIDKVNRLVPHIRQAFKLYEEVNSAIVKASSLSAVLDAIARPSIVLSDLGQVIHANHAASALLQEKNGIKIIDNRLLFRDRTIQTAFAQHMVEVLRSSIGLSPFHSASLYLPRPQRQNLILCLTPIENIDENQPGALLTLIDPERRELPDARRIAKYFSLTPAEAQLCSDLVSGDSLKTIASRRHKSEATLRSYLKQVYQKTGYNRQGQLVSGILSALIE